MNHYYQIQSPNLKKIIVALILLLSLNSFGQTIDTAFYSVVNLGKIIGENNVWKTAPNEYHYYFYFNDRGRGNIVNETVITNANGKVEKENSSGLEYLKSPYTSSFKAIRDSLISQNNDNRIAERDSGQYYVNSTTPAGIEIFIKALMGSPNHRLPIMGGDTASIKTPKAFTLSFRRKKVNLLLCDINYGKGSSPSFTWLDEDYHFFGDASGWMNTIKKGYENLIDTLHALQDIQAIPFYQGIYKQLSDSLPTKLAIKNVLFFDAPNAKTISNITVLIENGIITAKGKSSEIQIPKEFTVIDGTGKTLLPGLWDTHGHYSKDDGINYLSGGITHVRDMGNMPDIIQMQKNIRLHNLTGPDISYLSGFIDKDDEYHGPVGKLVHSQSEAIKAVDYFHDAGYDQIKIYSSIDTAWVKPMCREAHRLNMRVAGHLPLHLTAGKAVQDGFDEITHMNMIMLNFFPDTIDTRKNRFKPVGQSANTIDLKSKAVKDFIQLLKENNTVVEPTMNVFEEMFNSFPGDTSATLIHVIKWMPEVWRQNMKQTSFMDETSKIPAYKESYNRMLQMLKLLYDNGITLLIGTDGGYQLALHHELELFVKAGIPANEALRMATYNPTKVFNLNSKYGSVENSRIADFILVDGNPVEKISDIRQVFMVVTNHSLYYPKKLYKYSDWGYYY